VQVINAHCAPDHPACTQVRAGIHKPSQGKVDERWRAFMKFQIARARQYFKDAEDGVDYLDVKARWPVW